LLKAAVLKSRELQQQQELCLQQLLADPSKAVECLQQVQRLLQQQQASQDALGVLAQSLLSGRLQQQSTTAGDDDPAGKLGDTHGGFPTFVFGQQMGAAQQTVTRRSSRKASGGRAGRVEGFEHAGNHLFAAECLETSAQRRGADFKVTGAAAGRRSAPAQRVDARDLEVVMQPRAAAAAGGTIKDKGSDEKTAKIGSAPLAAVCSIAAAAIHAEIRAALRAAQEAEQEEPRNCPSRIAAKELLVVLQPRCQRCDRCPVIVDEKGVSTEGQVAGEAAGGTVMMVCCPGGGGSLPAIQEITDSSSKQVTWRVDPSQAPLRGAVDAYYCLTCFDELKGVVEEDRRQLDSSGEQPGGAQALGDVVVSSSSAKYKGTIGGDAAAEVGGTASREGGASISVVMPAGRSSAVVRAFKVVRSLKSFCSTLRRPPFVSPAVSTVTLG
jgi:hypothetical protein